MAVTVTEVRALDRQTRAVWKALRGLPPQPGIGPAVEAAATAMHTTAQLLRREQKGIADWVCGVLKEASLRERMAAVVEAGARDGGWTPAEEIVARHLEERGADQPDGDHTAALVAAVGARMAADLRKHRLSDEAMALLGNRSR